MSSVMKGWGEIKQEYQIPWEIAIKLLVAAGAAEASLTSIMK